MSEQSIRRQIAALEAQGRIARIARAVDPATDMAAVALKLYRERGRSAVFADAAAAPAAAQLLADRGRWATALGVAEGEALGFVGAALKRSVPPEIASEAPLLSHLAPALERLPMPRASAGDSAPQMAAVAVASDAATGRTLVALTRHAIAGPGRLAVMDFAPAFETLRRRALEAGEPMKMALVLGADPALILAAAIGTWRAADMGLAGSLAGAPMRLVRESGSGLAVPAEAEAVILGEIGAGTARVGRLATAFGTHREACEAPVFEAKAMLARHDAVFHAMHVGAPGDQAGALCLGAEALVAEHIRNIEGGIDFIDIRCPPAAGAQVVVVKLVARVEGQAKTALMGALSGPVHWLKFAIAVDEDVDPADLADVFWSVASRTHAEKDVGKIAGMRAHPLDFAAPAAGAGGARTGTRWFIDSTMPPLTQGQRRDDFARAIPKNLAATELARFLPER
jgi:2,5-furandicarboxylate decarboxylase 1